LRTFLERDFARFPSLRFSGLSGLSGFSAAAPMRKLHEFRVADNDWMFFFAKIA